MSLRLAKLTLIGVNQFKGLDVTDTSISLQPDEKGDNFHGWVNIPNPSILEVEIVSTILNILTSHYPLSNNTGTPSNRDL